MHVVCRRCWMHVANGLRKLEHRHAYINRFVTDICIAETDIDMSFFGVGLAVGWLGGCHAAGVGQAVEICLDDFEIFYASVCACFGFMCSDLT